MTALRRDAVEERRSCTSSVVICTQSFLNLAQPKTHGLQGGCSVVAHVFIWTPVRTWRCGQKEFSEQLDICLNLWPVEPSLGGLPSYTSQYPNVQHPISEPHVQQERCISGTVEPNQALITCILFNRMIGNNNLVLGVAGTPSNCVFCM